MNSTTGKYCLVPFMWMGSHFRVSSTDSKVRTAPNVQNNKQGRVSWKPWKHFGPEKRFIKQDSFILQSCYFNNCLQSKKCISYRKVWCLEISLFSGYRVKDRAQNWSQKSRCFRETHLARHNKERTTLKNTTGKYYSIAFILMVTLCLKDFIYTLKSRNHLVQRINHHHRKVMLSDFHLNGDT